MNGLITPMYASMIGDLSLKTSFRKGDVRVPKERMTPHTKTVTFPLFQHYHGIPFIEKSKSYVADAPDVAKFMIKDLKMNPQLNRRDIVVFSQVSDELKESSFERGTFAFANFYGMLSNLELINDSNGYFVGRLELPNAGMVKRTAALAHKMGYTPEMQGSALYFRSDQVAQMAVAELPSHLVTDHKAGLLSVANRRILGTVTSPIKENSRILDDVIRGIEASEREASLGAGSFISGTAGGGSRRGPSGRPSQ